ncbi:MAG: hypothetical protein HKN18_11845 [Silicimonas sp.]|nr:hypothetical protein [Silicimonas sp.]
MALSLAAVLAGCSTTTTPGSKGVSPLVAAANEEAAATMRIDNLFAAEGTTQQTELPTGNATYEGLVHGDTGGGSGPDLEYYADLTLEVDFDTDGITGTVDNVRTDLGGFITPSGSAPVTGSVSMAPGDAELSFAATGTLTGVDRTATYDLNADGDFIGDTAQAARGTHTTDFIWTAGPDTGDTSWSDGDWLAEQ